ncbi:penicillin-binding protein 2 [Patescibacteria group bacterium]|nr:penicillin-binding protein 2 [Patescibacteria group bacterium]
MNGEDQQLEVPLSKWSTRALYVGFVLLLTLFLFKTFELQVFATEEMQQQAQNNAIRSIPVGAERGVVYDKTGKQLVFNRSSFDLMCDKRDLPSSSFQKEVFFKELSDLFGLSFEDIRADFDKTFSFNILLTENLSHEKLVIAEARIQDFPGCRIQENTVREYVNGLSLAHVLGYTAKISPNELLQHPEYAISDQIGKTGIEKTYEAFLRGEPGHILFERDAFGNIVKEKGEKESVPGKSVQLWLDMELQEKLTVELQKALVRVGSKKAAAVAIDPQTGGVLALVSLPSFDNNLFSRGISYQDYQSIINNLENPLFNRAIAGTYPAGSTIKPFIATGVLQEKLINPDQPLFTKGYIEIENEYDPEIVYVFPDWKNHGWVDMRQALAVSSNVYFYIVGGGFENQEGLGPSRIKKYLSLFSWGSETGIDLPGESVGLVPDPAWKKEAKNEGWWDGDTYLLSIGQGDLLVTPLQVAASFVQFANGGTLYVPKMVKGIIEIPDAFSEGRFTLNNDGGNIKEIPPEIIRNDIIDAEDLQIVREGMRQAVKWGSSVLLNQLPVSSAAKTGTAQTGRKNAEGNDLLYSWVNTFAPYEDPEIVLTIMVEDAEEGSLVVLPVAKEILEWYFTR